MLVWVVLAMVFGILPSAPLIVGAMEGASWYCLDIDANRTASKLVAKG